MNKIEPPLFDDYAAIDALSTNTRVKSYPKLLRAVPALKNAYLQYTTHAGNAKNITGTFLFRKRKKYLETHYTTPPKELSFIKKLRSDWAHKMCPMCGSLSCGTLDHVLPQVAHPEFTVFSKNLVPACGCNSKRGANYVGANPGERVLHPYFDNCLSRRLITVKFEDLAKPPKVTLRLLVKVGDPDYDAIKFHVGNVLNNTGITKYLGDRWIMLCQKPERVVRQLEQQVVTMHQLGHILVSERRHLDDEFGGKNNWRSIFVSGLLDKPVMHWLFHQLNRPGRAPGDALL